MTTTQHLLPPESDLLMLLEPVSADREAGQDLDGSIALNAFEMDVREPDESVIEGIVTEDTRDWRAIANTARSLLATSKDLRVAVQLTRALHRTRGLSGLCEGLLLTASLAERFWETLYPPLDPDDGDATARINALRELASAPFLAQIRGGTLATVPLLGPISTRDALDALAPGSAASAGQNLTALSQLGPDALGTTLTQLTTTRDALTQLLELIQQKTGQAVSLLPLLAVRGERPGLLDLIERLFSTALGTVSTAAVDETNTHSVGDPAPSPSQPSRSVGADRIASREDVIATLERICAYYAQAEPASPVPLLLRRAQRLIPMDFLAIIQDLARDGLPQVNVVAGLDLSPRLGDPAMSAMSHANGFDGMNVMMESDDD